MSNREASTPDSRQSIHVHIRELRQLFNTLDATPFPERDLDADADEFIFSWAMELPRRHAICLQLFIAAPTQEDMSTDEVASAIRNYYTYRARILNRQLRELLARGHVSLIIGLFCLASSILAADLVDRWSEGTLSSIVREGLIIGGWVAMWGPLQILLYDWWPLRRRGRVCERLAAAEIEIHLPVAD